MSYKPKAPPIIAAPNVIPMADIMLVLLIIVMVITPMIHPGVPVEMAMAENADQMPGAEEVPFADVARAIDVMRGAGIDRVGLITRVEASEE